MKECLNRERDERLSLVVPHRDGIARNEIVVAEVGLHGFELPMPCECGWLYNSRTRLTVCKTTDVFV